MTSLHMYQPNKKHNIKKKSDKSARTTVKCRTTFSGRYWIFGPRQCILFIFCKGSHIPFQYVNISKSKVVSNDGLT